MNNRMQGAFAAVLQDVVIPEVIDFIRSHHAATGTMPTNAEVFAALNRDADAVISEGKAWDATHPPTPPTP